MTTFKLNVIGSWTDDYTTPGVRTTTLKYEADIPGAVNRYPQTKVITVSDTEDHVHDVWANPSDALNTYLGDAFDAIKSAAQTDLGQTFTEFGFFAFSDYQGTSFNQLADSVNDAIDAVSTETSQRISAVSGVNIALSDHENDMGAHPLALATKQDHSAMLDTLASLTIANNEMVLGDTSGLKKLSTTTTGQSLMSAIDASAARAAISAGTSSFDGAYSSLTGKPSFSTVAATGNYYDLSTKPVAKSFNNAPTPTIQTTAAAANGNLLSSFRDAEVSYSVSIDTSVSLSGNASGHVVLEIAPTNSTTASDWKEISRVSSGQSGTLVIGLTLNQTGGGSISGIVPAGYYRRLRKVNVAGTPTINLTGCQEVLDEPLQVAA